MAQIENLTQALMGTTSNEGGIRQAGEQWLQRAEQSNLTGFLVALITELATEGRPPQARQAAGLKLKNIFESRNVETKQQLAQQWKQIPVEVKNQIKTQVLATLHSNVKDARKTTAQLLSTLANMELHQNSWGDVIQQLTMNVTQPKSEFGMESSLMALGYLCEECKAPALAQLMNPILSAVIHAMKQDKNTDIRLEATRALINSLVFIHKNFENEKERNVIMGAVCEATLSQDPRVRVASLECMSRISTLYYSGLSIEYIQAIFKITQTAKADKEEVAMQAIDIWTTIAEIEADILADIKFAEENGMDPPKKQCKNFIKTVYKPLIGILTELLVNQSENQADDDWNRSTAAATCLAFIAKVVGDAVVEATMPFISQNIQNQNWKFKEAATLAFSAILDGPTSKGEMKNLISKAVPIMLNHVTDKVSLVRDTTVFTLGRIALYHLDALIDQFLDNVVKALMFAMKDEESSVASKACWAVHNIAEGFDGGDEEPTNALSKHFKPLVEGLVYTTNREDVEENNLQLNTYEALRAVIQGCARDVYPLLDEIAKLIIQRLRDTLNKTPTSISEREEQNMIQSLLCGTLQAITNKMGSNIKKYANDLMQTYVAVMRSKPSGVHEDTLVAVGALATAIGKDFEPFMKVFEPHLHAGLKNKQEEIVCNFSVNTVGDLCVALEGKITPYADQIVSILLQNLQDPHINKNVKPGIISCFGDIALAVGGNFERYLKHVGLVLKQAAEAQVNASNDEMIEFMNRLRESIFEAYAGILQGLKKEKPQAFHPYVDQLAAFLKIVAVDPTVDDVVFKTAVSVIGDLANVYGSKAKQLLSQEFIAKMVQDAANSEDPETKDNAKWVQKQLKRIMTVA